MSELPSQVSDLMDPTQWRAIDGFPDADVTYHRWVERGVDRGASGDGSGNDGSGNRGASGDGSGSDSSGSDGSDDHNRAERDLPAVRIAFNRPEVRNAFRPQTVDQLYRALDHARMTADVGTIILTGNGPADDGVHAFCSGGDQRIRGRDGYLYEGTAADAPAHGGRLHILEVQRLMRTSPKVIVAAVNGWAAGGGHSLNVVADLSIASREHARFKQTDANVGSFDAGYGSTLLARHVGDKRAREIFFLAREYSADDAERWGVVNEAVPHAELEARALDYARIVATKSPQAIRMLKFAFNLADDGLAGQQVFAGEATRMAYMTDEAQEGRDAFLERRDPDWRDFPYAF